MLIKFNYTYLAVIGALVLTLFASVFGRAKLAMLCKQWLHTYLVKISEIA